jgi:acid phosphatase type 7
MTTSRFTRRQFMHRTLASGAAAYAAARLAGCAATPATNPAPAPPIAAPRPDPSTPILYWTAQTEASLAWPVTTLSSGWVEYGATPSLGNKATAGDDIADYTEGFSAAALRDTGMDQTRPQNLDPKVLRARLKNLPPGTQIFYRIHTQPQDGSPVLSGNLRQFTLPDAHAPQARIAFWNDTHDNQEILKSLHALTPKEPTDLLVWNGDASNNIDREDQIVPIYLAPAKGLDITRDFPLIFVRGNHDQRGRMAAKLGHYSALRSSYLSFRLGPVAAIVLDTGEDKPDNHPTFQGRPAAEPLLQKQAAWLAAEILKPGIADAPFRIVICHMPLRWRDETLPDYAGSGYDHFCVRGRALWHDTLVRWKAQLVISGHTHESLFMPPSAAFPYAQIIGGAPQPNNSRLLRLTATPQSLKIRSLSLTNTLSREESFSPLK